MALDFEGLLISVLVVVAGISLYDFVIGPWLGSMVKPTAGA